MNRIIKFPTAMVTGDYTASSLVLDGGSVIDQCIATAGDKGTFFLEQHLLYVVLGGEVRLTWPIVSDLRILPISAVSSSSSTAFHRQHYNYTQYEEFYENISPCADRRIAHCRLWKQGAEE